MECCRSPSQEPGSVARRSAVPPRQYVAATPPPSWPCRYRTVYRAAQDAKTPAIATSSPSYRSMQEALHRTSKDYSSLPSPLVFTEHRCQDEVSIKETSSRRSVLLRLHDRAVLHLDRIKERHRLTQLSAYFLDLVRRLLLANAREL